MLLQCCLKLELYQIYYAVLSLISNRSPTHMLIFSKYICQASNQIQPSALFSAVSDRPRDISRGNLTPGPHPSGVVEQWRQPLNVWKSGLHPWMPFRVDNEDKILQDPSERVVNLENSLVDTRMLEIAEPGLNSLISGPTYEPHPNSCVQTSTSNHEMSTLKFSLRPTSHASPVNKIGLDKVSKTQSQLQTPRPPIAEQFYSTSKNGVDSSRESQMHNEKSRGDSEVRNQLIPRYWPKRRDQELQLISGNSTSVITPLFEKILSASDAGRIGRLVLPKKSAEAYLPAISHPEGLPLKVQDIKGNEWVFQYRFWPNNNSRMYVLEGVTPCIQEMQLQAGDIVTFSRMDPEGKLVMGSRKASDEPPDQGNQTFKSGIGVMKLAEVTNKKSKPTEVVPTPIYPLMGGAELNSYLSIDPMTATEPTITSSKPGKTEVARPKSSLLPSKRKGSFLGSNSKRLLIETDDLVELKLTWEEAQGLLRPPPNTFPNLMLIEGHAFEEYEEAPVLGKPTIFCTSRLGESLQLVQCESCSKWRKLPVETLLPSKWTCFDNSDSERSSCSSAQEVTHEQIEELLLPNAAGARKKTKAAAKKGADAVEALEGLENLADLAILGEGGAPSSSQTTTKHPRHRHGCACIVCIQPPSGKSHKDTCTCNACLTVKRRHQSLLLRLKQRQSEKDAEAASQKLQLFQIPNDQDPNLEEKPRSPDMKKTTLSPVKAVKAGIDLNFQPDREGEAVQVSEPGTLSRLLREATNIYLKQQTVLCSEKNMDPVVVVSDGDGGVDKGEKIEVGVTHSNSGSQADCDINHPTTLSTLSPTSTSAIS
ncbi:hypothetical protein GIB67_025139 [Kingdonia uniflora]|uniref:B3 domain-containing protein n=1 Tax=Kingdonia uniflora TaxID=39325 RepID=A0A7J7N802_9MAGN|nr:hypothetical protein GIB67_025139 [Kingdonia uniflora]